jgi:hypothetical protein
MEKGCDARGGLFLPLPLESLTFPRGQLINCLEIEEEFETKLQIDISNLLSCAGVQVG